MEWHEKEFGWLWKNVGEHFSSLLHGLYVKKPHKFHEISRNFSDIDVYWINEKSISEELPPKK